MQTLKKYFPYLTEKQENIFDKLPSLYKEWNEKINVISRKDIDFLLERHILHSLGIAQVLSFQPKAKVLDIGTGGGFPGIPLAILFPETSFVLVDSIGKKIKVVQEVAEALSLTNVTAMHSRAEEIDDHFDFIVSRAVTQMPTFINWTKNKFLKKNMHSLKNGILYLKGGDLTEELKEFPKAKIYPLSNFFEEDFFETKKVVYLEN
ncbi:16S rRNA (guanine(527)-N(7))-methyltransferase RsmG [Apibacter muscae]|uniref:Ribosomal RNA small subunit methyltransferase G n=1 Tax=Apibacter muscae TaxID=2509004 RepID=A0A563DFJ6_9FLAO|nr:16S rRNA (guanine(527)-N(7))-methyltransferase RsmG [Apibacter muscae]TWP28970.1 16S rRNA (guanine(527)-N(7))-methyltransferase RsmG [Apibacter muscae]